jgi:hypothetical protein
VFLIKDSFELKEILEEKKNELSPHSKIPPFFSAKFLQSKGGVTIKNFAWAKEQVVFYL